MKRLINWLRKPLWEKLRAFQAIPMLLGWTSWSKVYLSYHPDSQVISGCHDEFKGLERKFIKGNKFNQSGDISRLWSIILNVKQVMSEGIPGDFAELGVWRGCTASILTHFAAENNRRVVLFDTFEGFNESDLRGIDSQKSHAFCDTSLEQVKGLLGNHAHICDFAVGYFPYSATEAHRRAYSVVNLDCDLYLPTKAGLSFFYPLMPKGGLLMIHDYSSRQWEGCKQAVDEFCTETGEQAILMPDKSGSVFIRKSVATATKS
jgi:Macrocin-O-methyltransferase (TylF)